MASEQPSIADTLKYANLQMAAEALLTRSGARSYSGSDLADALVLGNDHASKFTKVQATDFAKEWEVLDQKANTATGFSGTRFQCIKGAPTAGLKAGDSVGRGKTKGLRTAGTRITPPWELAL